MMRQKANRILISGIVVLVLGAVYSLFLPNILFGISGHYSTQLASNTFEILLRTIDSIVPALGAALVASGIVLRTIAGRDDRSERAESAEAEPDESSLLT